ncbi:MAG: hypothetical protein JKY33_09830 [Bacteroidia bacterium]|nr:hypothetical protein [Bacteroidia bacterium]
MNFEIEEKDYNEIAEVIHSDSSPVGIDAKKTHILIIKMLNEINERLDKMEEQINELKK